LEVAVSNPASFAPEQVLSTLTSGFIADPIMRWLYPEPQAYLDHFPATLALFGGAAFEQDTADMAPDGGAAAMWLPPDAHPDGEGLMALFERVLSKEVFEDALKVFEIMDEVHPDGPCWHLAFIATDWPDRGQGKAGALMERRLEQCDRRRQAAYLENTNPANTAFYAHYGFEVTGEIQAGAAPPMFAMLREPR
jgi:GNAT superfamily N-acetyltransferase